MRVLVTGNQLLFGGVRDSQWSFFVGNYQEYEVGKRKRLGEEGARPHRPRYKPLRQWDGNDGACVPRNPHKSSLSTVHQTERRDSRLVKKLTLAAPCCDVGCRNAGLVDRVHKLVRHALMQWIFGKTVASDEGT